MCLCLAAPAAFAQSGDGRPWRAHEAAGLRWLKFGLEQRTRLEHLEHDFRPEAANDSTALSLRTLLSAEVRLGAVELGVEGQDSRTYATAGTPLNNTLVNPLELLQGWAGLRRASLLAAGDSASLRLGRFTMNVGSRRLIARNGFRNTINGFTGADLAWASPAGHTVRAFAVMPVIRLPSVGEPLADNAIVFDRENTSALLWGVFAASGPLAAGMRVEAYVFGLHEGDHALAASADRRLVTSGLRLTRSPEGSGLDLELEAMVQLGTSRATANAADTADLAHRAASVHAACGYRFDVPGKPQLQARYDFASGDADPADGLNGRFDPLFGARVFDFGPTGLYGAFARSNIQSPGVSVEVAAHRTVDALVLYRLFWLASARDGWAPAGLTDATGSSGTFVGHQLAGRVRWRPLPGNVSLEVGGAWLVKGRFAKTAPGGRAEDAVFVYTELSGAL